MVGHCQIPHLMADAVMKRGDVRYVALCLSFFTLAPVVLFGWVTFPKQVQVQPYQQVGKKVL